MAFTEPDRLKTLPPYLFVDIDCKRRAAVEAGRDIIDLGIGDPDLPTPVFIIERMTQAVRRTEFHHYPHPRGDWRFRQEISTFFHRRYGVALDPEREILALIGSKEGLGHLPLAIVNPGEVVFVPDPAYPVYRAATGFAGGQVVEMRLSEATQWLPDLGAISESTARRAKLMFLNYPNNPTGAVATRAFFQRVVDFARAHNFVIAHDAAYNELWLADEPPPSILEIPGAGDVAVEFHSLSKTFNMTGWRVGFVAGNVDVINALARIKANIDSGVFTAVQEAAIEAYRGCGRSEVVELRQTYRQRAEVLCAGLLAAGFRVRPPPATFYVWAGLPAGNDSLGVANKLLDEAGIVCVPGTGFGPAGEGYVRFALTVALDRLRTAAERVQALRW